MARQKQPACGKDFSATDGAAVQTYHLYDGLGSTAGLTDGSGDVVDGYSYEVFGATRSHSGASDNPWLFTGEQLDADSDMYYLRARYYDPAIGRFLSQDPLPAGHSYVYGANNPVRYVDPSGLCIPGITCPPGMGGDEPDTDKEGGNFCPAPTPTPTPSPMSGYSWGQDYWNTFCPDCPSWQNAYCYIDGVWIPCPTESDPLEIPLPDDPGQSACQSLCRQDCPQFCLKVPGGPAAKAICVFACGSGGCAEICRLMGTPGEGCPPNC